MKKLLALLLVLIMAFSLFACGEDVKPSDDTENKDTNGDDSTDNNNVVESDPFFLEEIEAACGKMGDAKAFDASFSMTLDMKASGMTVNVPVTLDLQMKWTGDMPETFETLKTVEAWNALGLVMKMSCDMQLPALVIPQGGNMKVSLYFADGIFYVDAYGEKQKVALEDVLAEMGDEVEVSFDKEQILGLLQALVKGVEKPSSDLVAVKKTAVDGGTKLEYAVKGDKLYAYVKSALQTICANADSDEVKAMIEAIGGTSEEEFEEEEPLYTQEYDFDNIDWATFFRNEMEMSVEEVKNMYISIYAEGEDWSDAEWEAFFQQEFNPDASGDEPDSAADLYNMIYSGEYFTFSFKDVASSVVLKNGMIASMEDSFGIVLTIKATEPEQQDSTVDLSASMRLSVNAIGAAVNIVAPADLDSYIEMPSDLDSSFETEDEYIA